MQQLVINVDAPGDILAGYGAGALIRVERDTTSEMSGAQEITTIAVVEGTTQHEYWDTTGSTSHYYRTRFSKASPSLSTDYSGYSDIFQGGQVSAYASIDDLKEIVHQPDGAEDNFLIECLEDAAALIDSACHRQFYRSPLTGTETWTFDIDDRGRIIDPSDIVSITTLEIGDYTGSTYTTVIEGATGYYLRRPAGVTTEWPYELVLSDMATQYRTLRRGYATGRATGVRGWAAIPRLVRRANLATSAVFYRAGPHDGQPSTEFEEYDPNDPRLPRAFWAAVRAYERHLFHLWV